MGKVVDINPGDYEVLTAPAKQGKPMRARGKVDVAPADYEPVSTPAPSMLRQPASLSQSDEQLGIANQPLVNVSGNVPNPNIVPVDQIEANKRQGLNDFGHALPFMLAPAAGKLATTVLGTSLPALMASGAATGATAGLGTEGGSKTGAMIGATLPLAGAAISRFLAPSATNVATNAALNAQAAHLSQEITEAKQAAETAQIVGNKALERAASVRLAEAQTLLTKLQAALPAAQSAATSGAGQAINAIKQIPVGSLLKRGAAIAAGGTLLHHFMKD